MGYFVPYFNNVSARPVFSSYPIIFGGARDGVVVHGDGAEMMFGLASRYERSVRADVSAQAPFSIGPRHTKREATPTPDAGWPSNLTRRWA